MKFTLDKEIFSKNLTIAQKFTSDRLSASPALQGIYLSFSKKTLHTYATDLNTYCHLQTPLVSTEEGAVIIDPKKTLEFISLLQQGDISGEITEGKLTLSQGTTRGVFPTILIDEYPLPPTTKEKPQKIPASFFQKHLPFLLFTASTDDARPVLTGVQCTVRDGSITLVTTDGFRLSIVQTPFDGDFPQMIIPARFLKEVLRYLKEKDQIEVTYMPSEKMFALAIDGATFSTRLIEGDFPAYERVIPKESAARATLNAQELLRKTKIVSIFARDFSNVILYQFEKGKLTLSPKKEGNKENATTQDVAYEGEPLRVAFNFRYIIDFLNNIDAEDISINLLRADAPVVFRPKDNDTFTHIIMPVRITEEG